MVGFIAAGPLMSFSGSRWGPSLRTSVDVSAWSDTPNGPDLRLEVVEATPDGESTVLSEPFPFADPAPEERIADAHYRWEANCNIELSRLRSYATRRGVMLPHLRPPVIGHPEAYTIRIVGGARIDVQPASARLVDAVDDVVRITAARRPSGHTPAR